MLNFQYGHCFQSQENSEVLTKQLYLTANYADASENSDDLETIIPKTLIKGFGDISYNYHRDSEENSASNYFSIGHVYIFFLSNLSDNVIFLNELMFGKENEPRDTESNIHENKTELEAEVERLYVKYTHYDYLSLILGKFHTPLGYWNKTFEHGTSFQTTPHRPLFYAFEDHGGILPMHLTGLNLTTRTKLSSLEFELDLCAGNGRSQYIYELQDISDKNQFKAILGNLKISSEKIAPLSLLFYFYFDKIPPNTENNIRNYKMDELISGGSFVYVTNNLELLSEFSTVQRKPEINNDTYSSYGFYAQGSYRFMEKWRPFYRYDYVSYDENDPYRENYQLDSYFHSAGVKFITSPWFDLRLVYTLNKLRNDNSKIEEINFQLAFSF